MLSEPQCEWQEDPATCGEKLLKAIAVSLLIPFILAIVRNARKNIIAKLSRTYSV